MGTARLYAWSRRHPVLVDATLAAALFLTVGLPSAIVAGWVGLLFGTLLTLPLAVRRRWPVAVFASTVVVSLLQLALISQPLPADIVPPFVLYTVAAHVTQRWVRVAAVAAGVLACVLGPWRWAAAAGGARTRRRPGPGPRRVPRRPLAARRPGPRPRGHHGLACSRPTRRWPATASSATSSSPSASAWRSPATSTTSWPTRSLSSWSRPTGRPTRRSTPTAGPATRRSPP